MAILLTYNGTQYTIPTTGEAGWGTALNRYLIALATGGVAGTVTVDTPANGLHALLNVLSIDLASATDIGVVNITDQDFKGVKNFIDGLTINGAPLHPTTLVEGDGGAIEIVEDPVGTYTLYANIIGSQGIFVSVDVPLNRMTISGPPALEDLTGVNSGDVTLASVGSTPNANGASLSGQALTLQPASATLPGVLTAGIQTIGGPKTLLNTAADSGTAVGVIVDTSTNWVNTNALLASFRNNGAEKAYVYKDGSYSTPASIYASAFRPSAGASSASIVGQTASATEPGAYVKVAAYPALVNTSSKIASFGDNYGNSGSGYVEKAYVNYLGGFQSLVASGSDGVKLLDGARLNFSTADANAHISRAGANFLETPSGFGAAQFSMRHASYNLDFGTPGNSFVGFSATDNIWHQYYGTFQIEATAQFKSFRTLEMSSSSADIQLTSGGALYFNGATHTRYLYYDGTSLQLGGPLVTNSSVAVGGELTATPILLDQSTSVATPSKNGAVRGGIYKVTVPYTAFTGTGADTLSVVLADIPAKTRITSAILDCTTEFNIPSPATDMLMSLGYTGAPTSFFASRTVVAAATFGLVDSDLGAGLARATAVQGGKIPSWTVSRQLLLNLFAETGGPLSGLTKGSVTITLTYDVLS